MACSQAGGRISELTDGRNTDSGVAKKGSHKQTHQAERKDKVNKKGESYGHKGTAVIQD